MRTAHKRSCSGCYWCCQCEDRKDVICDNYTPLDPEEAENEDIPYYSRVLKENHKVYEQIIDEYSDKEVKKEKYYGKEYFVRENQ